MSHLPHSTLPQWCDLLSARPAPVLAATRDALEQCRARAEKVDANALADLVLRDPLMTLRVLQLVTQRLGARLSRPVETVTGGLVLLGIEPFFGAFVELETVEDRLAGDAAALAGVHAYVGRAQRSARLAAAFAVHRMDDDAEVLHQAALLHGFSGLLLWCESPAHAHEITARRRADPGLRSAQVQRDVLGAELPAIERQLMQGWGLTSVLRAKGEAGLPALPGARSVSLAVRISRHLEQGWDDPGLPDDFAELGRLLQLPAHAAQALVREVAD